VVWSDFWADIISCSIYLKMNYSYPRCRFYLFFIPVLILFMVTATAHAQFYQADSLKLISRTFAFTEGPAVNAKGDVFFY